MFLLTFLGFRQGSVGSVQYSWTISSVFSYLGWLAAPTDLLCCTVEVFACVEGRQSWPGGLVSFVRWLGLFRCFLFVVDGAIWSQCF